MWPLIRFGAAVAYGVVMRCDRNRPTTDDVSHSHDYGHVTIDSDRRLILENAYFLDAVTVCTHPGQTEITSESGRRAARAIDGAVVVVDGGTNVVPNHHLRHRAGGGSPPVRYQGGTVRSRSEVANRA